jgi:dienelactone hydrolase
MRLTAVLAFGVLLTACGGVSTEPAAPPPAAGGTTSASVTSLDERAQLLEYDQSEPLEVGERKTRAQRGAEVVDLAFQAADRRVSAYLVRPQGKPRAAVLWAHWYGEGSTANRTEFLPDALELAQDGVVSLLPQGMFPWEESVSESAATDLELIVDQTIQLRRGLDLLEQEAGGVPIGFVGHDYGAMFGILLVADGRPETYVLMAPDATFSNWFIKYFVRGASKPEMDRAFAPVEPVNNVADAAPASVFLQFAESDRYVPYYVADKLTAAASDPKKVESYASDHELEHDAARKDRLAWLRAELGLS